MSATIRYEVEDGIPVPTARPDAFWCELVRVFQPHKSKETGDGDPYGVTCIELKPDVSWKLWGMSNDGWDEATCLARAVDTGSVVMVYREP